MKLSLADEGDPLPRSKSVGKNGTVIKPDKFSRKKHFQEVDFQLEMRPRQPGLTWEDFTFNNGIVQSHRVALDGYVNGPSIIDTKKLIGNFDHHEGCNRLATRATCAQIWMEIRAGFYNIFRNQYGPKITAFVNDRDEDDALSTLLLAEPNLIVDDIQGQLRRLVNAFDELDSTAGMCAVDFHDVEYQKIFWMTEPYRVSRNDVNLIRRKDTSEYTKVLVEIQNRIKFYLQHPNDTPRLDADTKYETVSEEDGWIMVDEIGSQARLGALADGHTAIVSHKHMGTDELDIDLHRYIFALTSANYHPYFPLGKITDKLNEFENCSADRWGGNGNTVIGSPRDSFSKTPPTQMLAYIRDIVKEAKSSHNGLQFSGQCV